MASVKTAISLEEEVFRRAEELGRKMKVSRSRLFRLAIEEFIRRHENRELLARINAVHADAPDATEQSLGQRTRRRHRRMIEGQW